MRAEHAAEEYRSELFALQTKLEEAKAARGPAESASDALREVAAEKDAVIASLHAQLATNAAQLDQLSTASSASTTALSTQLSTLTADLTRAREENASYQVLLEMHTVNGDFSVPARGTHVDANADGATAPSTPLDHAATCTHHAEARELREQNRALTLYVNKIIGRLLQSDTFEEIWEHGGADSRPTPSQQQHSPHKPRTLSQTSTSNRQSLMQRASSVFGAKAGPATGPPGAPASSPQRPHVSRAPSSADGAASPAKSTTASAATTPSMSSTAVPLARLPASPAALGRANVGAGIAASRRGPPPAPTAPPLAHVAHPDADAIAVASATAAAAAALPPPPPSIDVSSSAAVDTDPPSPSARSVRSEHALSGGVSAATVGSRPPSEGARSAPSLPAASGGGGGGPAAAAAAASAAPAGTGAGAAAGKMRPLRLVREKNEADAAAEAERKRANRASWVGGWFG